MRPCLPRVLPTAQRSALLVGPWEVQRTRVRRRFKLDFAPSLGCCQLRNCRHFRGPLGGPAEGCPTGITVRPRRPLGAAICASVATFVGSWEAQRSARDTQIAPRPRGSRGGLRTAQLSPLSLAPGRPSGKSYAGHNYSSPPPGGLRSAQLSPLSWAPGRPSGGTSYADHNYSSSSPGGAAICAIVATFVSSWESQRSGGPRRSLGTSRRPGGGCDLRNRRHFRELLGGPAQ